MKKFIIRTKDVIKDEKILVEMFNKHYVNIVEKTSGIAPKNLGNPLDQNSIKKLFVKSYYPLPLLSCESSMFVKENPDKTKFREGFGY